MKKENKEFEKFVSYFNSQAEIAREFDLTPAMISQIRSGDRKVSVDFAYRIVTRFPQLDFLKLVKPQ